MQSLFRSTKAKFGKVDVVVANAGMMESQDFFDFEEDESGELLESPYSSRVVDVNLKGTMNSTSTSPSPALPSYRLPSNIHYTNDPQHYA